jgi:hypothetical protein
MKALNPFAAFWYTPRSEQGADKPTRFKIRGLDGAQQGYIAPELLFDERTLKGMTGKGMELALGYGLVDWENFENDQGPLACAPTNFALIEYGTRVELAMQILAASYVTPAEKKT